jgi:hypothetical protein
MNYVKLYENLIEKWRHETIEDGVYSEKHHIIPRCLGGSDEEENLILLPARVHYVAHEILAFIYPDNQDIIYAVIAMSMHSESTEGRKDIRIPSRLFAYFRERAAEFQRGKIISEESRHKMSLAKLGKPQKKKAETGKHISEGKKGKPYGTRVLDTNTGKIYSTFQECSKDVGYCAATIRRWVYNVPEKGFILYTGEGHFVKHHRNEMSCVPVIGPDGTEYRSMKECARKTGHELRTLKRWIETSPEKGFKYKNKDKA